MYSRVALLGIDIGTLSAKGVLVTVDGKVIAEASTEYEIIQRQPGWVEHDPVGHWWHGATTVVRRLLRESGVAPKGVLAVGLSGLFPSLCLLGSDGEPLAPAMLYSDVRGGPYLEAAKSMTGLDLNGDEAILKLMWLLTNRPELLLKTRKICSTQGYVGYRLTGRNTIDHKTAVGFGGLLHRQSGQWNAGLCRDLSIDDEVLPDLMRASAVGGGVSPEAAAETGLAEGTPVLVGAPDSYVSLLGHGALYAGDALVYYGTTGYLAICKHNLLDMLSDPKLADVGSPWFLGAYVLATGSCLQWFRDQFLRSEDSPVDRSDYQTLERLAMGVEAGAGGLIVLPYFNGQRTPSVDPHATAAVFGLTMSHTRAHLSRALMESFGYALLHGMNAVDHSTLPRRLVAGGGGARSQMWRQMVTDIVGVPQEYAPSPGAPLGAAFLAGYGLGLIGGADALERVWLGSREANTPNPEAQEVYRSLFPVYAELSESLASAQALLYSALQRVGTQ